jgi:hypothetical protein
MNTDAFSLHSRNFGCEGIAELLARAGVEANTVEKIIKTTELGKYLQDRGESVADGEHYINDLADRRNEVAHGIPTDILAMSELRRYVEFFIEFSRALTQTLFRQSLRFQREHRAVSLGKPIKVFRNKIVGIPIKSVKIRKGDLLIAETSKSS